VPEGFELPPGYAGADARRSPAGGDPGARAL